MVHVCMLAFFTLLAEVTIQECRPSSTQALINTAQGVGCLQWPARRATHLTDLGTDTGSRNTGTPAWAAASHAATMAASLRFASTSSSDAEWMGPWPPIAGVGSVDGVGKLVDGVLALHSSCVTSWGVRHCSSACTCAMHDATSPDLQLATSTHTPKQQQPLGRM